MTVATADALVLDPKVQNYIGVVMTRTGTHKGVGYLSGEDVRQHLQEAAFRAALRFDGRCKFITYIYQTVYGAAVELLRSHGARDRNGNPRPVCASIDADAPPVVRAEDEIGGSDESVDLVSALAKLPQRMRVCLILTHYEQLGAQEVAERMRLPVDGVRQLLHAATMQMRLLLK